MTDISKFAPKGGWKERAYYVVEVCFNKDNPIHKAILYTGFLNGEDKSPGGYSGLFNPTYEPEFQRLTDVYFMRVVYQIEGMQEV
jgi:hypothetical protein